MAQRSVLVDGGLPRIFVMQISQGQIMGQDIKIKMIKKQSSNIKAMMKIMMKDRKKVKNWKEMEDEKRAKEARRKRVKNMKGNDAL